MHVGDKVIFLIICCFLWKFYIVCSSSMIYSIIMHYNGFKLHVKALYYKKNTKGFGKANNNKCSSNIFCIHSHLCSSLMPRTCVFLYIFLSMHHGKHTLTHRRKGLLGFPPLPGCKGTTPRLMFRIHSLLGEQELQHTKISHCYMTISILFSLTMTILSCNDHHAVQTMFVVLIYRSSSLNKMFLF